MADVFLSYAREDARRVEPIVHALRAAGWSVFWDQAIPPGATWRQHLGGELAAAGCVLVVWSAASVRSDWVADEAEEARRRGVLLPVMLDGGEPPLGFRGVQALDLSGADLREEGPLRERLVAVVAARLAASGRSPTTSSFATSEPGLPDPGAAPAAGGRARVAGYGALVAAAALLAFLLLRPPGSPSTQAVAVPASAAQASTAGLRPVAAAASRVAMSAVSAPSPQAVASPATALPAHPATPPRPAALPKPQPQPQAQPPVVAASAAAAAPSRRAQFEAFAFAPDGLNLDRAGAARWADARMAESPPLDPRRLRQVFALAYRPDGLNLSRAEAAQWALARLRAQPDFDVARFETLFRQGFDRGGRNLSREEAARWALAQMHAPP